MTMDFTATFIEEEVPPIARVGRDSYPWEDYLAPVREKPGVALRVYTFETKNEARSRAATIQKRWTKMIPLEEIKTTTRGLDDGSYGVYVTWLGEITQERRDEISALSDKRRVAILAARQKPTSPPVAAQEAPKAPLAANGAKTTAQRLKEAQAAKK